MKLTDTAIRKAKPGDKTVRLSDGGGMYLELLPSGARYWRMKYRFNGKEKRLAIGVYPEVSLKEARKRRDEARQQIEQGIDPGAAKRAAKLAQAVMSANTFEAIGREWWDAIHRKKVVPEHANRNLRRLELDAFPALGRRPIHEITAPELLAALRRIESRGHIETARRVRTLCGQIFRYAITTGRGERDPAADLKEALLTPSVNHHPAITDPKELPGLLRAIDGYGGHEPSRAALKLSAMIFVRPGELRHAQWGDIDLDEALWSFKASKTKTPLVVPLPSQAVAILRHLQAITGRGRYVFPSVRTLERPMSNNTVNGALHRLGFKDQMTAHGFRAMARTILAERLNFRPEYIEQQLAHAVKDAQGRAYNRTQHLEQRRGMLQTWADYLDTLKAGTTNVVPLKASKA